jgi:hypothetical protein
MKNNLIIILSHCDTEEKKEVLINNVNKLKSNNFDILLVSHIPIPSSIQELVEYFIYDKSNPIINWPERGMVFWQKIGDNIVYRLLNIYPDYGWTALNQILLGGNLGLSLNYNYFSFINYDIQLTDSIIEALKSPVPFLTTKVKSIHDTEVRYPSFLLNIISRKNLKNILPLINKEHYIKDTHLWKEGGKFRDAEEYWEHLITNFSYTVYPNTIVDSINFDNVKTLFTNNKNNIDKFKIFFQNNNTHSAISNNGIPGVLLYEVKIPNLKLVVNEKYTSIKKGKNEYIPLPKIKRIGVMIDEEYTDLTEEYNKSIYQKVDLIE